jgi:uncharacterized protein (TIGR03382 family)
LLLAVPTVAAADTGTTTYVETVVTDTTTPVDLKLDSTTVLCSSADYGALFLKVLIPDLAHLTLLDHQNIGAGAPCVASGQCRAGNMPADIIDPAHPTERVDVNVQEVRADEADAAAQTCTTTLFERVHVTIRGINFTHERSLALGTRPFSDCATSAAPAGSGSGSDTKADDPGTAAPEAKNVGCNSAGGTSGGLIAAAMALVLTRRRQR